MKHLTCLLLALLGTLLLAGGCFTSTPTSDDKQQAQQETMLDEATAQTGMPAIKNFRERRLLKDILELRDQDGLVTFTYVENAMPVKAPGKTIMGGKFTYLGESVGYGLPYSTQYTNPQKIAERWINGNRYVETLPQADPNALFSPDNAEGTWVLLKDPGGNTVRPVYMEPRIMVSPFKLPFD